MNNEFRSHTLNEIAERVKTTDPPTWKEIVADTLNLDTIEEVCRILRKHKELDKVAVWYGVVKPLLVRKVGWEAQSGTPSDLKTNAAYDVAYKHLYKTLTGKRL